MTNQTISNFFIPMVSKEITIKLQPLELDWDNSCEEEEKEYSTSPDVPYGLLDGSKQNDSYKELIELLGITNISNQEIRLTIENNLIIAFEIIKKDPVGFSSNQWEVDMDAEVDSNSYSSSVGVIFLWRRYSYSIKSIAAKLSISRDKVTQIISQYKANVRKICKASKRNSKNSRWSIDAYAHQAIREYWYRPTKRPIRIKDIKEHVWPSREFVKAPHNSTISRVLRNKLSMSYKVLQKRNPKLKLLIIFVFFMNRLQSKCC